MEENMIMVLVDGEEIEMDLYMYLDNYELISE